MLRNYLLVAIRGYMRNKVITGINIAGLATAMAATLIILQYVAYHLTYDRSYVNGENKYRVGQDYNWTDSKGNQTLLLPFQWEGFIEGISSDFSEITSSTWFKKALVTGGQFRDFDKIWLTTVRDQGMDPISTENFIVAASNYFQFFKGSQYEVTDEVLSNPNDAVISNRLAKNLFGTADVVGESIVINSEYTKIITAVYDIPERSSYPYDLIMACPKKPLKGTYQCFIELQDNTGIEDFVRQVIPKMPEYNHRLYEQGSSVNVNITPLFQPLHEVHFSSFANDEWLDTVTYSIEVYYILAFIGLLVSAIAMANYFNLVGAQFLSRAKEVRLRKLVGAKATTLFWQYALESMLIMICSFMLALTLSQAAYPRLVEIGLEYQNTFLFDSLLFWLVIGMTIFVTSLLTGLFKSLLTSKFRWLTPSQESNHNAKPDHNRLQRTLLGLQFGCAVGLIIGISIINQQINFILGLDLGYSTENTIVVKSPNSREEYKTATFIEELKRLSGIKDATASLTYPGHQMNRIGGQFRRKESQMAYGIRSNGYVEANFASFYELDFVAGRGFKENYLADTNAIILSEHAVQRMEFDSFEEALNSTIIRTKTWSNPYEEEYRVIGIYKDYYMDALHEIQEITGSALLLNRPDSPRGYYSIKTSDQSIEQSIAVIEELYNQHFNGLPFDFFVFNDHIKSNYAQDYLLRTVLTLFTVIAIAISCLGLFALTSLIFIKRTKEIGIRKVLGATFLDVFKKFSTGYLSLLILSTCIAIPLTWYTISSWLDNYAVRIELSWHHFLLPAVTLIFVTALLLFFQVRKVSKVNPVESLRYE